jgi:ElaB/YqjD/DUF883 family membrane-anchored ribosome-binding protein
MIEAQILLRQAHQGKRPRRLRTRAQKYLAGMRPPAGPALAYRKILRSLSDLVARRVLTEIGPLLEQSAPRADQRQDADVRDTIRSRLDQIKRGLFGTGDKMRDEIKTVASRAVEANAQEFTRVLSIDPRHAPSNLGHSRSKSSARERRPDSVDPRHAA